MERVKDSLAALFLHVQEQVLVLMNYNEEESESVWNIFISFMDISFYSPLQYGDVSILRLPWVYVSFSWTYPNVSCHVEYVTADWSKPAARNTNEYINTYGPV